MTAPDAPETSEPALDARGQTLSDAIESTAFFIYAAIGLSVVALLCCGLTWMVLFTQM